MDTLVKLDLGVADRVRLWIYLSIYLSNQASLRALAVSSTIQDSRFTQYPPKFKIQATPSHALEALIGIYLRSSHIRGSLLCQTPSTDRQTDRLCAWPFGAIGSRPRPSVSVYPLHLVRLDINTHAFFPE
jgi:hypothetical protein